MQMQMPKPGAEHQQLARLAGHWVGRETMYPSPWSPEQRTCTGVIRARVLEGFFVISDYEQHAGDDVTFRGHGVYSWDAREEQYVMYWFDSMGGAGGVARGHLEDNVLIFQNTSPMGHHRYRYTFEEDRTVFEMSASQDGESWHLMMRGEYEPAS